MKRELMIKKCTKCGAMMEVLQDCHCKNCEVVCCGETMKKVSPNSVDAAFEKHVPTFQRVENKVMVTVNHVMENDHYIEWIAFVGEYSTDKKFLQPGMSTQVLFPYEKGAKLYAYCNKHGLWETEIN